MSPPSGPAAPPSGSAVAPSPDTAPIGPVAVAIPAPPPARSGVPSAAARAAGAPAVGSWTPAPRGFAPTEAPSWLRTLRAISRAIPGRSSWPANRPRKPGARGAAIRSSTCSTTCTAAVRPKRTKSARGSGSRFLIVPVASPSVSRPPAAFDSVSVSVSSPSSCASSSTATSTVCDDAPAWNVSVPLAAV